MSESVVAKPARINSSPQEIAAALPVVASAARWFWWIAGLSVVNILLFQSGSNTNFVVGLAMTAISDELFAQSKMIGFATDAVILGFFVLMGLQALRGKLWAFYLGTAVYLLDALIYLVGQDWMPVAFHAFAVYCITRGALALRAALQAE